MKNETIYKKIDVIVNNLQHLHKAPSKYVKKGHGGFSNDLFIMAMCKFECGVEERVSEYLVKEAEDCLKFLKRQEDIDKFYEIIKLAKKLKI